MRLPANSQQGTEALSPTALEELHPVPNPMNESSDETAALANTLNAAL